VTEECPLMLKEKYTEVNNGKASTDLWFRGMDIEKAGRGTLGENRNENVTMDPWFYLEGQEKK